VIGDYQRCLTPVVQLVADVSPFPSTCSGDLVEPAGAYLQASEDAVVVSVGQLLEFAGRLLGAVQTTLDVADAYQTFVSS
jgi:hypothetical protein